MMEMLTISGPLRVVEPTVKAIKDGLRDFDQDRVELRHGNQTVPLYDFLDIYVFHLSKEETDDEEQKVTFALFLKWHNDDCRARFQDPTAEDETSPQGMDVDDDFWETTVAAPLRALAEKGVSISSWDYEAEHVLRGRRRMTTDVSRMW